MVKNMRSPDENASVVSISIRSAINAVFTLKVLVVLDRQVHCITSIAGYQQCKQVALLRTCMWYSSESQHQHLSG